MGIYVEVLIRAPLETLWAHTQDPARHQQWDLRFSRIDYLPKRADTEPQRFHYATRIGFGLEVAGEGESVWRAGSRGRQPHVSARVPLGRSEIAHP